MLSPCAIMAGVTPAGACARAGRAPTTAANASSRPKRVRMSIVAPLRGRRLKKGSREYSRRWGGQAGPIAKAGPIGSVRPNELWGNQLWCGTRRRGRLVRPLGRRGRVWNRRARARGPGAEDGRIVRAAWIPQYPGVDAELLGGADLLAHVLRGVAWLAQGERLQVGADLRRPAQRLRPAERILHRPADDLVRLAVRMSQAVVALEIMAGVDHRQHHVGRGHQVFPHLADPHVGRRAGREAEDVDRER